MNTCLLSLDLASCIILHCQPSTHVFDARTSYLNPGPIGGEEWSGFRDPKRRLYSAAVDQEGRLILLHPTDTAIPQVTLPGCIDNDMGNYEIDVLHFSSLV